MNSSNEKSNGNIITLKISRAKTITVILLFLLFAVLASLLWNQQQIDADIVLKHNRIYENELLHEGFALISRYGMGLMSLMLGLLALLSLKSENLKSNRQLFLWIVFSFAVASIGGDILKELIGRTRPVEQLAGQIAHDIRSATSSFPSGHAAKSMGLVLVFLFMASNKTGINIFFKVAFWILSVLVCYSRIALQKHFPSDIMAGISIAMLSVVFGVWMTNFVYRKRGIGPDRLAGLTKRLGFVFLGLAVLLSMI
ncbi:phosphatase PAP2 family protein [candidate division KSB1 bacterium]|nr:phosphatase PAP2 family protein [candidate division KSB1 bacterium]